MLTIPRRELSQLALGVVSLLGVAAVLRAGLHVANPTIAALVYLLVVLVAAARSRLAVAVTTALAADLCLNYFFIPPLGTLAIADPQNWVVLLVFLAVSAIGSQVSAARQREELTSALLASLGHDLKTPLTTIRVAASNLKAPWLQAPDREEQSDLILAEVERLGRLFQNILEMAGLDCGAVSADIRWVHPAEIGEAARDQVEHALRRHRLVIESDAEDLVRLDPRLTASALAQLLENAAHYSGSEAPITVRMSVSAEGLTLRVRDRGPGIAAADLPHLFDRFYRGRAALRRISGTGMGLSIARGML